MNTKTKVIVTSAFILGGIFGSMATHWSPQAQADQASFRASRDAPKIEHIYFKSVNKSDSRISELHSMYLVPGSQTRLCITGTGCYEATEAEMARFRAEHARQNGETQ